MVLGPLLDDSGGGPRAVCRESFFSADWFGGRVQQLWFGGRGLPAALQYDHQDQQDDPECGEGQRCDRADQGEAE